VTTSALDVVTVGVGGDDVSDRDRIPVREFLSRMRAAEKRDASEALHDSIAVYRIATAISYPPLKLVADTLKISQSTATRLMTRARDAGLAPEVRIQEPRRAPAVDPYNPGRPYDPAAPHAGPSGPGGPSIGR
jgi:DNA-binding transcriptional ArsR family regulator